MRLLLGCLSGFGALKFFLSATLVFGCPSGFVCFLEH